jgi:anthranilate synthase component 1
LSLTAWRAHDRTRIQIAGHQGYNRIPLIAEAFADLETPLTLYLKLAQTQNAGKNTFLLESVVGGERFGRYSFIGLPATTVLRSLGNHRDRQERRRDRDARRQSARLHRVTSALQGRLRPGMPRFCGGLAGYFGYDTVRYIEKKLADSRRRDDWACPTSSCW